MLRQGVAFCTPGFAEPEGKVSDKWGKQKDPAADEPG